MNAIRFPQLSSQVLPIACWLAIVLGTTASQAQFNAEISLDRPGEREFVLDKAALIAPEDETKIREIADKLLTDKGVPIVVVTIESMKEYAGAGLRIETFARLLFDQWGVGYEKIGQQSWNYGMLLLVSRDDRKARIELGADWRRDQDVEAQNIMNDILIPEFKQGDFSKGLVHGVAALDRLGRGLPAVPATQRGRGQSMSGGVPTGGQIVLGLLFFGLALFTIISLIRRGSGGFAWLFWGVVFSVVGAILYQMLTSRSRGSRWGGGGGFGGGGFGGGSFGGGFSGGGGASGSW